MINKPSDKNFCDECRHYMPLNLPDKCLGNCGLYGRQVAPGHGNFCTAFEPAGLNVSEELSEYERREAMKSAEMFVWVVVLGFAFLAVLVTIFVWYVLAL